MLDAKCDFALRVLVSKLVFNHESTKNKFDKLTTCITNLLIENVHYLISFISIVSYTTSVELQISNPSIQFNL